MLKGFIVNQMKVITISNQKGGVAKTTTVVSVGGCLSQMGYRTLLVDLDPHGSLTTYFGGNPESSDPSLYSIFKDPKFPVKRVIVKTKQPNLSYVPASMALATVERSGSSKQGLGLLVKTVLSSVSNDYDFVLLDSPPMLGVLMVNALAACDILLIPVQTDYLAFKGLERMLRTLEMIYKSKKSSLPYLIVPTMFDRRTRASMETLRKIRLKYEENCWAQCIPVDTKLRDASQMGVPIGASHPNCRASEAYAALSRLVLDRLELAGAIKNAV